MILQVIIGFFAVLLYLYYALTKNRNYWQDRGVPNTGFKFLWGDEKAFIFQNEALHDWAVRQYKAFPGVPYFGTWGLLGRPQLMIRNDFDLIRSIWIKDFDHFAIANANVETHKTIWPANKNEKLMLNNVQSATGDAWKDIRYYIFYFMFYFCVIYCIFYIIN